MLVWVREQMDNVSYTYQNVVKRSVAEKHLADLLEQTGWTAGNIEIQNLKMADGSATTTVEFTTLGTVNPASGSFPIEPIIKAFKDLHYLEVQFVISTPFSFRGLEHFENKYVKIALNRGTNVYGYSIFVKDPNFTTLNLPLVQPPASTSPESGPRRSRFLEAALIVLLGVFAAVLVYFVMRRASRRDS